LWILKSAKALAYIEGRDFVIPEDIKEVSYGVLRHRIILSYEALAEDITADMVIQKVLENIEID
jgi:MoxR-like ATPase